MLGNWKTRASIALGAFTLVALLGTPGRPHAQQARPAYADTATTQTVTEIILDTHGYFKVVMDKFPTEFNQLIADAATPLAGLDLSKTSTVNRFVETFTRASADFNIGMERYLPGLPLAPTTELTALAEAKAGLLKTLQKENVRACKELGMDGVMPEPGGESPEAGLRRTAYLSAYYLVLAAGRDHPTHREPLNETHRNAFTTAFEDRVYLKYPEFDPENYDYTTGCDISVMYSEVMLELPNKSKAAMIAEDFVGEQ